MNDETPAPNEFACSARLSKHAVVLVFFDRSGARVGEVSLDPFLARRLAREIEDLATVALNNLAADRTGSPRPGRRSE